MRDKSDDGELFIGQYDLLVSIQVFLNMESIHTEDLISQRNIRILRFPFFVSLHVEQTEMMFVF